MDSCSKYNWLLTAEDSHKENIKFSLQKPSKPVINPDIQKENAKVVDAFDVEDIAEKAAFCRCWRSKKVRCLVCAPFIFWPNCQFPWIVMGRSCCQISQWYIQSRFIIMCTSIIWPEYILCVFLFLFSPFQNSFQNEGPNSVFIQKNNWNYSSSAFKLRLEDRDSKLNVNKHFLHLCNSWCHLKHDY